MKILFLLSIFFCCFCTAQAQLSKLDSAHWYHDQGDSLHYLASAPKQAIFNYEQALRLYQGQKLASKNYFAMCLISEAAAFRSVNNLKQVSLRLYRANDLLKEDTLSTTHAGIYKALANFHESSHRFDSAIYYLKCTIPITEKVDEQKLPDYYRKHGLTEATKWFCLHQAGPYGGLAAIAIKQGDLDEAERYLTIAKGKQKCQDNRLALVEALLAIAQGDFDKGLILYQQAYQFAESEGRLTRVFLNNIAKVYMQLGLVDQAIHHYKMVIEEDQKTGSTRITSAYNQVGELYRQVGAYTKALDYYQQAYSLVLEKNGESSFRAGSVSNNIGETYYALGNYGIALDWHQKSLSIRSKLSKHPYLTNSYDNLGMTYLKLGRLQEAEQHIQKAFQLRSVYPKNAQYAPYHIKSQLHLAELNQVRGNYLNALKHYQLAIDYNVSGLKNEGLAIYEVLNKMGTLHLLESNWEMALKVFDKAIGLNAPKLAEDWKSLSSYHNGTALLASLVGKGKSLKQAYQQEKKQEQLVEAFSYYGLAMQMLVKVRQSFGTEKDKLYMGKQAKGIYREAMKLAYLLYQQKSNDPTYLTQLFQISEQSKAGVLLDAQNKQLAQQKGTLPDSLIERESRLAALVSYYQQKINASSGKARNKWEQLLFENKRKQELLTQQLEKDYPSYYQLKYQQELASIEQVQEGLKENESLLEFFEGDSLLFAFLINSEELVFKALPKLPNQVILAFGESIRNPDWANHSAAVASYTTKAYQLYQHLIAPFGRQKGKLVIIPDGLLWHVNFDLLLRSIPVDEDYRSFTYLLQDLAIRYAYSGTYLLKDVPSISSAGNLLAFAPSYESLNKDEEKLRSLGKLRAEAGPLLYNQEEVSNILSQMDGESFLGHAAVERNFKKQLANHSIIHLAMHALVDNDDPSKSRLVFSHNQDSVEDNFLHVYELYNMDIKANLAVLSACNTGFGKLESGEGFMSLGRAFAYAGCPSVVMSHWRVDDLATSQLMVDFYEHLAKGMDKSLALQAAKLTYLESCGPREAAPFFWGSFVMMGDDTAIAVKRAFNWGYILVGVLLLFAALLVLKNKFQP